MTDRLPAVHYAIDPLGPLHRRWRDHLGPLRVITGPAEGWMMLMRPGERPFCVRLSVLLNADADPDCGPFEPVGAKIRGVNAMEDTSHEVR